MEKRFDKVNSMNSSSQLVGAGTQAQYGDIYSPVPVNDHDPFKDIPAIRHPWQHDDIAPVE